jgi:hypothetical protein
MTSSKFAAEWIKSNCLNGENPHSILIAIEANYLEALARPDHTKDYKKFCRRKIADIKNMRIAFYKMNIYHA